MPRKARSAGMRLLFPGPKLTSRLSKVFDRCSQQRNKTARLDFVFHMTDWLEDLYALTAAFKRPDRRSQKQFDDVVIGFVIHVIAHLRAAGRLVFDYDPDTFADTAMFSKDAARRRRRSKRRRTSTTRGNLNKRKTP